MQEEERGPEDHDKGGRRDKIKLDVRGQSVEVLARVTVPLGPVLGGPGEDNKSAMLALCHLARAVELRGGAGDQDHAWDACARLFDRYRGTPDDPVALMREIRKLDSILASTSRGEAPGPTPRPRRCSDA